MDKPPPILVIGGSGQLGRELAARASELGNFVQLDRRELDLTDGNAIARRLDDARPRMVVNAAAYTAVDKGEIEPNLAKAVNGAAVGLMAKSCGTCRRRPGSHRRASSPVFALATRLL